MGLVWVVHALIVALEWCFTLDLLDSSVMGSLSARCARRIRRSPARGWRRRSRSPRWLAAYNGIVRRRVAETLGQSALMLAMMAGGLWVIADPAGTVGALGRWATKPALACSARSRRARPRTPRGRSRRA